MAEHGFAFPKARPQDTQAGNPELLGWAREGWAEGASEGDARGWRSEVAPNRWGAKGPGRGGGAGGRKTVRAPAETGCRGPGAGRGPGRRTRAEASRLGSGARAGAASPSGSAQLCALPPPPAPALGARGRCLGGCGLRAGLRLSWWRPRAPGSSNFAVFAHAALSPIGVRVCGNRGLLLDWF